MMNRFRAKQNVVIAIILILAVAIIIVSFKFIKSLIGSDDAQIISIIISAIEALGLICSLIIALQQLRDSKEIARATFITEINRAFVENEHYIKLYDAFQDCRDKKCKFCTDGSCRRTASSICKLPFPKSDVSNYLTFFETIYLLTKNNVISFEILDDLFAYRFFLAVHHKFVQQTKLKIQPQNFKNIFVLEKIWLKYREKQGKYWVDSVYYENRLSDLIPKEEYEKLTS